MVAVRLPPEAWSRPDPPRLNDTSALQRKGIHPYQLKLRGQETVASMGKWTSPLETAWNAERVFNGSSGEIAASPPQGCGAVVSIKAPTKRNGGRRADGNGSVPSSSNLHTAVECCEKC
jgi:hypothetical protein